MAHTRKDTDVTEFQQALLGFLKEISKTIKNDKVAMDERIQNIIKINEKVMQSLARATMMSITVLEKSLAEKLSNALNLTLSNDYTENERLLKVLRGEIKDIKKALIQQQKPKI